jgi:hypothetical protein
MKDEIRSASDLERFPLLTWVSNLSVRVFDIHDSRKVPIY